MIWNSDQICATAGLPRKLASCCSRPRVRTPPVVTPFAFSDRKSFSRFDSPLLIVDVFCSRLAQAKTISTYREYSMRSPQPQHCECKHNRIKVQASGRRLRQQNPRLKWPTSSRHEAQRVVSTNLVSVACGFCQMCVGAVQCACTAATARLKVITVLPQTRAANAKPSRAALESLLVVAGLKTIPAGSDTPG